MDIAAPFFPVDRQLFSKSFPDQHFFLGKVQKRGYVSGNWWNFHIFPGGVNKNSFLWPLLRDSVMSITVVAQRAGVSSSTVSRVINNHPRVAPETVEIVRKVMAELNYTPSDRRPGPKPHARQQNAIRNIALIKCGSRRGVTPGFEHLLRGVSEAARRNNLHLVLCDMVSPEDCPKRIAEQQVVGALLHGASPTPELQRLLKNTPTVWLMGNRRRPEFGDQVMQDCYQIGRVASSYLLNRGHTRLALLNLDPGHWPFRPVWQSFLGAAEEAGAEAVRLQSPHSDGSFIFDRSSIGALADAFAKLSPRPTGLFIADDFQAALLQPALMERGVKFGKDAGEVEVISSNNEEAYLLGLYPRPATIDIRVESIGRKAVDMLLWRLAHPSFEDRIVTLVEPKLVSAEAPAPKETVEEPALAAV
jgi:LacI family transcriptional regulator